MVSLANIGNWTAETCSTEGSGDLILTGALFSNASFNGSIPAGKVWYSIIDGENREAGEGDFNGGNVIIRSSVRATIFNGIYNGSNPQAINLSGEAFVACTFNADSWREFVAHINDTTDPHDVQAVQVTYDPTGDPVTAEVILQDAMLDQSQSIEQRVASGSGVINGGSIFGVNLTQFSITDGVGEVFDSYTMPGNTSIISVAWSGISNVTIQQDGSVGRTAIFITAAGNVLQIVGDVAGVHYRENIFLGAIYYLNGEITEVANSPAIVKQTATDLYDSLKQSATLSGSAVQPVDALLSIWFESGSFFFPGINWDLDRTNPNNHTVVQEGDSTTAVEFFPMTEDGAIAVSAIALIPKFYNDTADNLIALNAQQATIHRIYSSGIGDAVGLRQFVLLYGQNLYSNADDAKVNLSVDDDNIVFPSEISDLEFLGHICVSNMSSDFDDLSLAWIVSDSNNVGSSSGGSVQSDHTVLVNRDALNQHPIESIGVSAGEQLRETLDSKPTLAGYRDIGLSLEYTGDLDDIVVNSTYAITSSNVTNAPADLTSGLRALTTFALSTNSLVQIIYGRGALDVYKQWMREASSAVWGPWEKVVDGAPFATTMSATPPIDPNIGDVWWDINTGRPYIYYDDGDSTQWVEENAPIVAQPRVTGVIAFARTASASTFDYQSGFASVVENVTGEYEYTFSSPLPNDQYIVQCNSSNADHNCGVQASSMTVNGFLLRNFNAGGNASASTHMVSVFQ